MIPPTKEQQRQAIRAQLIKEFNAPEKSKRDYEAAVGLSTKSKFLARNKRDFEKEGDLK